MQVGRGTETGGLLRRKAVLRGEYAGEDGGRGNRGGGGDTADRNGGAAPELGVVAGGGEGPLILPPR